MAWYYLKTGMNSKDMFGEVAYIELPEQGLSGDGVYEQVKERYPKFTSGHYIKAFNTLDYDIDSEAFDSEDSFLESFGKIVGDESNSAYTINFRRVSTKEARRQAN